MPIGTESIVSKAPMPLPALVLNGTPVVPLEGWPRVDIIIGSRRNSHGVSAIGPSCTLISGCCLPPSSSFPRITGRRTDGSGSRSLFFFSIFILPRTHPVILLFFLLFFSFGLGVGFPLLESPGVKPTDIWHRDGWPWNMLYGVQRGARETNNLMDSSS